jgi:hypothetical protein
LPDFVLFDEKKLTLYIETFKPSNENSYQIIMKGTTVIYNEKLSDVFSRFTLIVRCVPKKLSASTNPEFKRSFYLDDLDPLYIEYKPFEVKPICNNRAKVLYSALLKNGSPLPPYLKHLSEEQKFVITHESILIHDPAP